MNKHVILMFLCCLIPVLLILGLRFFGVQSSLLSFAAVLICPLMMVVMMVAMGKKSGGSHDHTH